MDDLVAFLRAQYDKDEQAARAATDGAWEVIGSDHPYPAYPGEQVTAGRGWSISLKEPRVGDVASELSRGDAAHISRHDPARVLADLAAKRRTLGMLADAQQQLKAAYREERTADVAMYVGKVSALHDVVKALAAPYEGEDGYQQEWKL